jgi:FG-GAP-like repeat
MHRISVRIAVVVAIVAMPVAAPGWGLAARAAPPAPRFVVPRAIDPGISRPTGVAAGDVNGDGFADAIATGELPPPSGALVAALGDGSGNFPVSMPTRLPGNSGACEPTPSDFDDDGILDVAVVGCSVGTGGPVFLLLGNGDGTFALTQQLPNGGVGHLDAADFDGDGNQDLVLGNEDAIFDDLSVYFGNGDGTVDPPVTYASNGRPFDVAVADTNGDGAPDLVVAQGGSPSTMLNDGTGTFLPPLPSAGMNAFRFTLTNLNGDASIDMAAVNASAGNVVIGLGRGDGTFAPGQEIPNLTLQTQAIAAGDFNGDGHPDLVVNDGEMTSILLLGRGDAIFGKRSTWLVASVAFAPADLNGTGPTDLISVSQEPGTVYANLGTRQGFVAPRLTERNISGQAALGDVNGDGRLDVVTAGERVAPGVIQSVLVTNLNLGRTRFGPPLVSVVRMDDAGSGTGALELADMNGDGRLDAVGGFSNLFFHPENLFVAMGRGDGTFGPPLMLSSGDLNADVESMAVADVTGDGESDIVSHTLASLSVLPGHGDGTFDPPLISGQSGPAQTATLVGDVTGDGILDVVAVLRTGTEDIARSELLLQAGGGAGRFGLVQTRVIDTNTGSSAIADLNGDGRPDVASSGQKGFDAGRDGLFVLLTTPNGRMDVPVHYAQGFGAVIAGDVNADGTTDLLTDGVDRIGLNLNPGDGTFDDLALLQAAGPPTVIGDVVPDGRPDIVSALGNAFALYVNRTP